jgi:hypothetical protein
MQKKIIFIICFLIIASPSYTQSNHQFSISYNQIKDGLNNGLLFKGTSLSYQFGYEWKKENILKLFSCNLNIGVLNRNGLKGYNLSLTPLQFYYGIDLWKNDKIVFNLGGCAEMLYQFQLYPDLQMGSILWTTLYCISPKLIVNYVISGNKSIRLQLSTSALGLISRPKNFDPYFFSLRFTDIVSNANSDFDLKTMNKLNYMNINLDYIFKTKARKISFGYSLCYHNYNDNSFIEQLNNSISIKLYRK